MDKQKFDAGKLRYERYKTFFQFIMAFLTAILFSTNFDIKTMFGINSFQLFLVSILAVAVIIFFFERFFTSLEEKLGWDESDEDDKNKEESIL